MEDNIQKRIFSKNLRRYMDSVGKPQSEVAKSIGVSPQTFNTWFNGIALPRMGKVQALADYFHCYKSDLIEDKLAASTPSGDAALGEGDIAKIFEQYGTDTAEQRAALSAALSSLSLPPEKLELIRQVLQMDPDQAAAFLPLARSIVKTP